MGNGEMMIRRGREGSRVEESVVVKRRWFGQISHLPSLTSPSPISVSIFLLLYVFLYYWKKKKKRKHQS